MSSSAGNRPVPSLFHLTTSVVHTHTHINIYVGTQVNKHTQGTHTPPGFPALGNRCGRAGAVPSSRGRMYGLACPPRKLFFPPSPTQCSPPPCLSSTPPSLFNTPHP
ncbi:hypothetical protein ATANTOWER_013299 [Ataeniobius toweri]|uniref:Uncharacterized protein n=1 Tax=Ataeniobius toweri TaxID=208326 RepID=A0ABU7AXN5_9TELE|nr:hypothetical protein [Ataeniobius toweri]